MKIKTLKQLAHNLNMGPGYDGYKAMVESISLDPKELEEFCKEDSTEHQRISIYDTPSVEAVVSYWMPGQSTPIHDYNFQQAWTKILKGQLVLEFFDVEKGTKGEHVLETRLLNEGDIIYMNDSFGYHRFANLSTSDVLAIHLFADKIDEWHVYDPNSGEIKTRPTSYSRVLSV